MKTLHSLGLALLLTACVSQTLPAPAPGTETGPVASDLARWQREASHVTIVRDDWGIAHVHGGTDAEAVFGMMYAQAEDDFNRVETNYLNAIGRLAEADGEREIYRDLRQKLFVDADSMQALYEGSPAFLKSLMNAYADGLNYYLATHPAVKPRVITRFEPWMALSFSEGSIGGDIERVNLAQLEAFYGSRRTGLRPAPATPSAATTASRYAAVDSNRYVEPTGSNGMAIAPKNTAAGHALLLINPHTSFFFRSELQMSSDEGLNAYGAVTWGQFFIYQGFNDRAGWMHTSSGVDAVDEFLETVEQRGDRYVYKYGAEERPVASRVIDVPYRTAAGPIAHRRFTAYFTHHGPIVREANGKWVSFAIMQKPVDALSQSFLRTKARDYGSFRAVADRYKANSSNNTIFADASGNIAYMHPQFVPRRNDRFDYTHAVDGSDPATDWQGLHALDESPHLLNPANGWIANSNDWPYSAAGPESPKRADFPKYMDMAGPNPRGTHYTRVLSEKHDFTIASLIGAAYDSWQPAFAQLIPTLLDAYDTTPAGDPVRARVTDEIAALRHWDYRWGATSVPTALAVFWGEALWSRTAGDARRAGVSPYDWMATRTSPAQRLEALAAASDRLTRDFGSWRTPWGEINRFQRLTGDIVQPFNDAAPSIPVGFTSAQWGSLASFGARAYPTTKRYYGTSGNSFVAVVEFGDSVRARAVTAGGESGNPRSPHFNDQAVRYSTGDLREVYYYPNYLARHTARTYRPGT